MKTLRRLFFETEMKWHRVIIFAVVTAAITALMLTLPFTNETSFSTIGASFEWWTVFAIIIAANCKKPLEAGLKVFVFFLVSQPLIYLFQVPFSWLGWSIFAYYKNWLVLTVLTLPGGMLAWYIKKDNILSAVILSLATSLLAGHGVYYLETTCIHFPKFILTTLFCFAAAVLLIFIILKKAKNRIIAGAITLLLAVVAYFLMI